MVRMSSGDYRRFRLTREHLRLCPAQRKAGTRSVRDPCLKTSVPGGCHPGRRGPWRARRRTSRVHIITARRGADSR